MLATQHTTVYRIAKWGEVFEVADSRKCKSLQWVALPIGFESHGYQAMVDEFDDEAPAIYGAWCALVLIAARAPIRGTLASSNGVGFTVSRLSRQACFPAAIFKRLIEWALRPEIGWLEAVCPSGHHPEAIRTVSGQYPDSIRTPSGRHPATPELGLAGDQIPSGAPPASPGSGQRESQATTQRTDAETPSLRRNEPSQVPCGASEVVVDTVEATTKTPVFTANSGHPDGIRKPSGQHPDGIPIASGRHPDTVPTTRQDRTRQDRTKRESAADGDDCASVSALDPVLAEWLGWWNSLRRNEPPLVPCGASETAPSKAIVAAWRRVSRDPDLRRMVADRDGIRRELLASPFARAANWMRPEKLLGGRNRDGEHVIRKLLEGGYRDTSRSELVPLGAGQKYQPDANYGEGF